MHKIQAKFMYSGTKGSENPPSNDERTREVRKSEAQNIKSEHINQQPASQVGAT